MFKHNTRCRMCDSDQLTKFFDLDNQALANSFLKKEDFDNEKTYPLAVYFCHDCHLSQLLDVVDKGILFRNYVYFSAPMPDLPGHFVKYAEDVISRFIDSPKEQLVVELGSNDGTLLRAFKEQGVKVLGIDPAENIAKVANDQGIETIPDFFSEQLAEEIVRSKGKARVIIGNNVVAHIDDHHDLMKGVKKLLDSKGVFIFEAPYLPDMFDNLTYDTIYHEHLSYLSVHPIQRLCALFDLELFDVQIHKVQGESLRAFVSHPGTYPVASSVSECLTRESKLKLNELRSYEELVKKINRSMDRLKEVLADIKTKGNRIAGYGAPAKGNTLLNYAKIGPDTLDYATEALPSKIGLYSPGMHIPVIDIQEARKDPPDFYMLLAWNYQEAILKNESEYRKRGGKFIIPVEGIKIL